MRWVETYRLSNITDKNLYALEGEFFRNSAKISAVCYTNIKIYGPAKQMGII